MPNPINRKLYFTLLTASILVIAASMPYAFTLAGETLKQANAPMPLIIVVSLIQASVLFAIAIYIGLKLSKKVGLGLPIIEGYIAKKPARINLMSLAKTSVLWGTVAGIAIILLDFIFTKLGAGISLWTGEMPPFWMGLLASFYGGIGEEILLRLFFMTLLVWIFAKLGKSDNNITGNNAIMWAAIVIAAVIFGLGHLPITSTITALTPLVIIRAIVLNGVGGIIFGWLYWKKGLESAIIAHFSADIVLHVLFQLLV